ncbi:uncharacterized protein LOC121410728 [Lytechinus variegatus]|uniref:uncharacterized protein LOC121410728 n=1 Tax=Lytechinus variegatus TaxID=7654 RepID=UPI001BB12D46|nr:uncharacterized protein LOC121410728 [Lytechinus variegatus]
MLILTFFIYSQMESQSSKPRPITLGICTSALKSNIEAFINKVKSLPNVAFKFIQLPYNDLDSFRLSNEGLDGVILCHSINNRRFAITDVMDALYDKFLPHVKQVFGKDNVCVIAHDFPWPMGSGRDGHTKVKGTYMDTFQYKQFTTFECAKLAIICGKLDKVMDMDEEDCKKIEDFVYNMCRMRKSYISVPIDLTPMPRGRSGWGLFKKVSACLIVIGMIDGVVYICRSYFMNTIVLQERMSMGIFMVTNATSWQNFTHTS